MIEMALVLPILLFLALGIVDFGRAINYWNDVNQIAADGARFAAVDKNPGEDTIARRIDRLPPVDPAPGGHRRAAGRHRRRRRRRRAARSPRRPRPDRCASASASRVRARSRRATSRSASRSRSVVETSVQPDPVPRRERPQIGQVKISGSAVMRLEQDYTMATGCTS